MGSERLGLILSAIKQMQDSTIILEKIGREREFVDGVELVYRALLQMQTIVSLGLQGDLMTDQMQLTDAIEETKLKIESDLGRRRTIL